MFYIKAVIKNAALFIRKEVGGQDLQCYWKMFLSVTFTVNITKCFRAGILWSTYERLIPQESTTNQAN